MRPLPDALGIALVLAPQQSQQALAQISMSITNDAADQLDDIALETLRLAIPAARGLPLLRAIAQRKTTRVVLDYLDSTRLAVEISPC